MNRDHLLKKDYLPTKFEVSGAMCSRVISCTRLKGDRHTERRTYRQTDRHVQRNMPFFFKGGGHNLNIDITYSKAFSYIVIHLLISLIHL